jgi:DNA-binding response OmpR family regulator
MTNPCILLADDEKALVRVVQRSLMDDDYQVVTAYDGEEALRVASRFRPDLMVLDVNMPRMGGLDVCRRVRQDEALAHVPILLLSVRDAVAERVAGLDRGADDYLGKPFDFRELKARIIALLRRAYGSEYRRATTESVVVGPVHLDVNLCRVRLEGDEEKVLTPTECDLLAHLMRHEGAVFSSEKLLHEVWGYPPGTADPSLVRWHVKNLREKIESDPSHPTIIRTLSRLGYVFSTTG